MPQPCPFSGCNKQKLQGYRFFLLQDLRTDHYLHCIAMMILITGETDRSNIFADVIICLQPKGELNTLSVRLDLLHLEDQSDSHPYYFNGCKLIPSAA